METVLTIKTSFVARRAAFFLRRRGDFAIITIGGVSESEKKREVDESSLRNDRAP